MRESFKGSWRVNGNAVTPRLFCLLFWRTIAHHLIPTLADCLNTLFLSLSLVWLDLTWMRSRHWRKMTLTAEILLFRTVQEAARTLAPKDVLGIRETAETFQDGNPLGEWLDKVTQVLQDLIPCCKETNVSKSRASGHVSLVRSAYGVGRRASLYSVKTGWRSGLEKSGKGREQSIQQPECLRSSLQQRRAVSQTTFI